MASVKLVSSLLYCSPKEWSNFARYVVHKQRCETTVDGGYSSVLTLVTPPWGNIHLQVVQTLGYIYLPCVAFLLVEVDQYISAHIVNR